MGLQDSVFQVWRDKWLKEKLQAEHEATLKETQRALVAKASSAAHSAATMLIESEADSLKDSAFQVWQHLWQKEKQTELYNTAFNEVQSALDQQLARASSTA